MPAFREKIFGPAAAIQTGSRDRGQAMAGQLLMTTV